MLKVAIGHSNDPDSHAATEEILEQCIQSLNGAVPQAGMLFAAVDFEHTLSLAAIQDVFPGLELIGCTGHGEVSSLQGFQQDSVTLILFVSDTIEIRAGLGRGLSKDIAAATQQAVESARAKMTMPPQLCLVTPESLTASGSNVLSSLQQALETPMPIYGGLAAEEGAFAATYQFFGSEVLQDAVPLLLFAGPLRWSHGVASGWQPLSQAGEATKVEGNTLYEIDQQTALDFYRRYMGNLKPSPEHPLAVFEPGSSHFYLRGFSGYDLDIGSITCFADIPVGATLQISTASRDDILSASKTAIINALNDFPGTTPEVALVFSCSCRRQLLGTRVGEEFQLFKQYLHADIPVCGFYSYGELAPLEPQGSTQLHQHTFVTLLLGTE